MSISPSRPSGASLNTSVPVPRQSSWHTPEGTYRATVQSISTARQGNLVRLTFNIRLANCHVDYRANLDLKPDLTEGSALWQVVRNLAGRKALDEASEGHFDLNRLIGLQADIEVEHNFDRAADYDFPLVIVTRVESAGRLVREEES